MFKKKASALKGGLKFGLKKKVKRDCFQPVDATLSSKRMI